MKRMVPVVLLLVAASWLLWGATATATWADGEWNTAWTGVTITNTCDVTSTFAYEATGGDPTHNWYMYCEGRNDSLDVHIDWTGTWEDLGVTVSNVVSSVQMTDLGTNCTDYTTCGEATFGPFELRDSTDTLVSTLWAGRTASADEDAWTAEGSQTAQGCGSICASGSSIELWMNGLWDTANAMNATCGGRIDNLDISIEHAAGAATVANPLLITKVRFRYENGQMVVAGSSTQPAGSD
jgi:hypothetical protein